MAGHAVNEGEGRAYNWNGQFFFTMKFAATETDGKFAAFDFITKKGEEPPNHTHDDEDEIFFLRQGTMTVRCGDDVFDLREGGIVFLPRNVEHGYTITSVGPVRMLVMCTPAKFSDRIERDGERLTDAEAKALRERRLSDQH